MSDVEALHSCLFVRNVCPGKRGVGMGNQCLPQDDRSVLTNLSKRNNERVSSSGVTEVYAI